MVAELGIIEIARFQQRLPRTESAVVGKRLVVAYGATYLATLIIAAEGSTGRNANQSVGLYPGLHHNIDDARREKPAHSASFKYQSLFHGCKVMKKC